MLKALNAYAATTAAHMAQPRVGDRFHEMYSFWVHVVAVESQIVVEEYIGGRAPQRRVFENADAFRRAYAYTSIPGYSVQYCDNLLDVPAQETP